MQDRHHDCAVPSTTPTATTCASAIPHVSRSHTITYPSDPSHHLKFPHAIPCHAPDADNPTFTCVPGVPTHSVHTRECTHHPLHALQRAPLRSQSSAVHAPQPDNAHDPTPQPHCSDALRPWTRCATPCRVSTGAECGKKQRHYVDGTSGRDSTNPNAIPGQCSLGNRDPTSGSTSGTSGCNSNGNPGCTDAT